MKYRHLYHTLLEHLSAKEYTILTGARQTGKSTLLRQLENACKLDSKPSVFINLEYKPLLEDLNQSPLNLMRYLPQSEERVIVFVDEVQYLDDPSNFLKLLYDEHAHRIKIIASGSSAFYIDRKFRDSLAGRKRIFNLKGLSFQEFLEFKEKKDLLQEVCRLRSMKDSKSTLLPYIQMEWDEYMIYGGYPAIVLEANAREKEEMLKEIRDSFVKKDMEESGVGNEQAFYRLITLLASQTGSLLNTNELARTLRMKHDTISSYLWILEKSFHISLVRPFHRNLRKELVKMPKIYFKDTGLRNCLLNNFQALNHRPDKGELWENTAFKLLDEQHANEAIRFWRTSSGNEIDFVLAGIDPPLSLEIKYDRSQVNPRKYKIFTDSYPEFELQFACLEPFEEELFRSVLFSSA